MGCGRKSPACEEVFASGSSSKKLLNDKKDLHFKKKVLEGKTLRHEFPL